MDTSNQIMVADSFSEYSEGLLNYAARIAEGMNAELIVASVINANKEGKMVGHLLPRLAITAFAIFFSLLPVAAGERFSDNGDGTITDHELGLMWSKTDNNGDINWIQAEKWVKFTFPLTLKKNYDNWRLPTLRELQSLEVTDPKDTKGYETDCGQLVKITPLIQLSCGWVWTSEEDPRAPTARIFNFDNVYNYTVRKSQNRGYRALPVRDLK